MNSPTIEESISRQEPGKLAKTLAYYASFIALGMAAAVIGPSLGSLAIQTGSDLSGASILFTTRALGYLLGSLRGGQMYDRIPGHPFMAFMVGLIALMMFLVPIIPLLWLLALVMLVLGVAEGGLDVGGNTLLVWVHRRQVGPFMNGLHFFFGLGAFLSPVIIGQSILMSGNIRWGYWAIALLVLPVAAWLLRQPSPANHAGTDGQRPLQANSLLVALLSLLFLLYVGAEVSFGGWIFSYTEHLDLAEGARATASAALLTSAFWLALTAGRLLAIPIAAFARPSLILLADLLGSMACVALVLRGPNTLTTVWVGTLGAGLFMASIFPTLISLAERRMAITGEVARWFFVGGGAGAMLLPWLIGQYFESTGPHVTLYIILGDLVLALFTFTWLYIYAKRPAQVE